MNQETTIQATISDELVFDIVGKITAKLLPAIQRQQTREVIKKESKPDTRRRMLSVRESAVYVGIAEKTLRNRIGLKAGYPFPVKPKRIGGRVLFDVKDLDIYLDKLPTT